MADRYLTFANSALGQQLVRWLGLPRPVRLRRYEHGIDFVDGNCLIGAAAGGTLGMELAQVLKQSSSSIYIKCDNPQIKELLSHPALNASDYDVVMPDTLRAVIFDATGIENSSQLKELYDFFHPVIRSLQRCGRAIILGRTPELCRDAKCQTAQRALEGFVRSLAKELGKGSTAQLIYVAEGAEPNIESSLRFFLSSRSAYVSAQVVRISRAELPESCDWHQPLKNRVALVTGAARGIGASIAEVMAREGAEVVCLDIPQAEDELQQQAEKIAGSYLAVDITQADAPQLIADYFAKTGQQVDIVVHNAGVTRDKTLGRMKSEQWDMTLNINLTSEERINDTLLDNNLINRGGHIICVSSIAGIAGNRGQTNYACSKAGVIGMVDALTPLLRDRGITINAVAPGFIETAMTAAMPFIPREAGRRINSLSQGGLPVDVAETICWYANPASSGVTGNVVRVCGQSLLGA